GPPAPELTVRVLPEGFGKRLGPAGAGYRDVRFERARLRLEARQGQVFVESPLQAGQPGRVPGHAGPDDPGAAGVGKRADASGRQLKAAGTRRGRGAGRRLGKRSLLRRAPDRLDVGFAGVSQEL